MRPGRARVGAAIVTLPASCGRCSSHRVIAASRLELPGAEPVIAARTARALEVRTRIVGPLELLCRSDAPTTRAHDHAADPVGLRVRDHRSIAALLTELRGQGYRVRLAARAPAESRPVDESDDRPQPVEATVCAWVTVRSEG